ncbi:MAG: hypothetical protein GF409_07605 [Candidatus Omnitrophica bacterium]|nr:hypothetical protein [Candidatus Omnitrophota bacterium]
MIDLFTVAAQIVNFLILVWILHHFLFRRIVRAMDERQERIRSRFSEAEKAKEEAEDQMSRIKEKREELEKEKDQILEKARRRAGEEKSSMLEDARKELDRMRKEWRDQVEEEKQDFLRELKQKTGEEVCQILRKMTSELANKELEEAAVEALIKRLSSMENEQSEKIRNFLKDSGGSLKVVSTFTVGDELKERLNEILRQMGASEPPGYEVNEGPLCGVELSTESARISWSASGYIDELEKRVTEQLEGRVSNGKG